MYIPEYKLAIEVDELGHCKRDLKCEIGRQKRIEEELGCKFVRIDASRENFDIVDEFSRIKTIYLNQQIKQQRQKQKKKQKKKQLMKFQTDY